MTASERLPVVTLKQLEKVFIKTGFQKVRQRGSHIQYRKTLGEQRRIVTLPANQKELKKGTLMAIINQADWTRDQFLHLLKH